MNSATRLKIPRSAENCGPYSSAFKGQPRCKLAVRQIVTAWLHHSTMQIVDIIIVNAFMNELHVHYITENQTLITCKHVLLGCAFRRVTSTYPSPSVPASDSTGRHGDEPAVG